PRPRRALGGAGPAPRLRRPRILPAPSGEGPILRRTARTQDREDRRNRDAPLPRRRDRDSPPGRIAQRQGLAVLRTVSWSRRTGIARHLSLGPFPLALVLRRG